MRVGDNIFFDDVERGSVEARKQKCDIHYFTLESNQDKWDGMRGLESPMRAQNGKRMRQKDID